VKQRGARWRPCTTGSPREPTRTTCRRRGGCSPSSRCDPAFLAGQIYARLGLLLARDGNWRGAQVISAAWIKDGTERHPGRGHLWPRIATPFFGYGYQTWIFPDAERTFALLGVRGQSIFVDPQRRLAMVHTAVRNRPARDPGTRETMALWRDFAQTLGK
jgi:CubicO group peptidase (beta-lactamase class C family)